QERVARAVELVLRRLEAIRAAEVWAGAVDREQPVRRVEQEVATLRHQERRVVGLAEVPQDVIDRTGLDDAAEGGLPQRAKEDGEQTAELGEHHGDAATHPQTQRLTAAKTCHQRGSRRGQHGRTSYA